MEIALDAIPEDMEALKAAFLAMRAEAAAVKIENARLVAENTFLDALNQKLAHYVAKLKRLSFGKSSERLNPDQLQLALEDLEQKMAEVQAEAEKTAPDEVKARRARDRRDSRPSLPETLPEAHVTIEPDLSGCPCCQGPLHVIGEDAARRLDVIPVQYRRLVTHRPKYACRACEGMIVQAPAPERLISGGLPTEAMVASVVVNKYADHQPLYRQSQALARQGIILDRSTLAFWVGYAAAELKPLWSYIREELLTSTRLFVDDPKGGEAKRRRRCWIRDEAQPKPATSGRSPATKKAGAERIRLRSSLLTRRDAATNTPWRCSMDLRASSNATATAPTKHWRSADTTRSSSLIVGAMSEGTSSISRRRG